MLDRFASIRCIRLRASVRTTFLFVQLSTDAGFTGTGEATMPANDVVTAKLARRELQSPAGSFR
jgi:hypothetical protein